MPIFALISNISLHNGQVYLPIFDNTNKQKVNFCSSLAPQSAADFSYGVKGNPAPPRRGFFLIFFFFNSFFYRLGGSTSEKPNKLELLTVAPAHQVAFLLCAYKDIGSLGTRSTPSPSLFLGAGLWWGWNTFLPGLISSGLYKMKVFWLYKIRSEKSGNGSLLEGMVRWLTENELHPNRKSQRVIP